MCGLAELEEKTRKRRKTIPNSKKKSNWTSLPVEDKTVLFRLYLIFLSELSSVDQTMIFFSIIFSCILIAVSGILEEKHIIFDDPVHGPHDRLSSVNQISAS